MNTNSILVEDWLSTKKFVVVITHGKKKVKNLLTKEVVSIKDIAHRIHVDLSDIDSKSIVSILELMEPEGISINNDTFDRVAAIKMDLEELRIKQRIGPVIIWVVNGVEVKLDDLIHLIWCHRQSKGKTAISRSDILSVLVEMDNVIVREQMMEFKKKIAYENGLPDKFEEVSRIISGENYDPMYPLVWKHVIWTIKRRVYGLGDYCPILVSIYGSAGKGKTQTLKAMFSILPANKLDITKYSKGLFEDERQAFRFIDNYVCIMDEFAGLSKSEINAIKNSIDALKHVYRIMKLNQTAEGPNNAQLIGTSNTRLRNIILSDTDIRKWAEVDIAEWADEEVGPKLVEPLKKFDWETLWRSVDENGPSPFENPSTYSKFKEWTARKCKHESPTAMFIDEIMRTHGGEWLSKKEIYDELYLGEVTEYALNWANFKEKCEKNGFKEHKRNVGIGLLVPKFIIDTEKDNLQSKENW